MAVSELNGLSRFSWGQFRDCAGLMPPTVIYHIAVQNTFLEFTPIDSFGPCLRQTLSCPCLTLKEKPALESLSEAKTCTSESLPEFSSSASTDCDVLTALKGRIPGDRSGGRDLTECLGGPAQKVDDMTGSGEGNGRRSKSILAMQMNMNKDLVAASRCSKPDLFTVIRKQLHRMNAVNLSTSIHRIARIGGPHGQYEMDVSNALLSAIEKQAQCELEFRNGMMPAKVATICIWSCASLQVFRPALFSSLIQVLGQSELMACKDFEITNVLWACSQFVKAFDRGGFAREHSKARGLLLEVSEPLHKLMHGVVLYFQHNQLVQTRTPILVSALVSLANLSTIDSLSMTTIPLFQSFCNALALTCEELSFNNKTQIGVACHVMGKFHKEVVLAASKSLRQKCLPVHFNI
eukprot:Skav228287  [mRNA]  locus=scaffold1313:177854:180086:+ [translate_table: standard]